MKERRYGFHLSDMWAGSNGMKCEECRHRTYSVWLTERECEWLPASRSIASQVISERKLGRVWCLACAKRHCEAANYSGSEVDASEQERRIAELIEKVEELEHSLEFTKQWWAERAERLKDLAKSNGTWPQVAAIIANGTIDHNEPPTYAVLLNTTKHEVERLQAENNKLRELLRREHAEAICIKCGLRQPGEKVDAGF